MSLESVRYKDGIFELLDQTLLPLESKYVKIIDTKEAWDAIKWLKVRGAPAIAIVGCLGLAVELRTHKAFSTKDEFQKYVNEKLDYLVTARPTAVHMQQAAEVIRKLTEKLTKDENRTVESMQESVLKELEAYKECDILMNKAMGINGVLALNKVFSSDKNLTVMTHCNAGALATGGYGTAIGVIRRLNELNRVNHVYCTETRPVCQGARLTAYELVHDKIPSTLICDNMVAVTMEKRGIDVIIIGADRVSTNGDTANKIGSYQLALLAKTFKIPFYVVCSESTIDKNLNSGSLIPIEERPEDEITTTKGQRIAAPGINCWNPAFDVTPASLITGIVTEKGVYEPSEMNYMKL